MRTRLRRCRSHASGLSLNAAPMTGKAPDEKPARHGPHDPAKVGEAIAGADLVTSPVRVQYPTDRQSVISDHLVRLIGAIIVNDEDLHSVPTRFSIAENPCSVFYHQRVTSVPRADWQWRYGDDGPNRTCLGSVGGLVIPFRYQLAMKTESQANITPGPAEPFRRASQPWQPLAQLH